MTISLEQLYPDRFGIDLTLETLHFSKKTTGNCLACYRNFGKIGLRTLLGVNELDYVEKNIRSFNNHNCRRITLILKTN